MRKNRLSTRPWLALAAVLTTMLFTPLVVVQAQEVQEDAPTPVATPTPAPTPLPAAEIPNRAAAVGSLLRDAVAATGIGNEIESIAEEFEQERTHAAELSEETRRRLETPGPASIIEETESAWIRTSSRIDGWMSTLKEHSTLVADQKRLLDQERDLWQLTKMSADEVELPEALRQQVDDTLTAIGEAESAVRANRDHVLTLQSAVAKEKATADEMLAAQKDEIARRRSGLVGLDSPPLWKTFSVPGLDGAPAEQLTAMWSKASDSVAVYVAERRNRLIRHGVFLALLVACLLFLRRRAALWAQQDRSLKSTVAMLDRPLAAAFIVTMLLGEVFHPHAPAAWIDLMGLCILLAVLRLLPGMLLPSMRPAAYLLALTFFLHKLSDFAPDGNLVNRLALFALSVTAASSCYWLFKKMRDHETGLSGAWMGVAFLGVRVSFMAFVVGAVANLIGAVGFASLLVVGTLQSIYAAVLFVIGVKLLRAVVRVVLITPTARRLAIVRQHPDTVRRSLFRVINIVAVTGWAVMTLQGFEAFEATVAGLDQAMESKISIGDFSVSPGDILIFILVVWLTFKISQLLRFVLEADVMPHLDLPRGVPGAISRLSHYAIIVVGVMIAATAAGLDFSRINLIVGALGVGIGFGLQTVVNNFVSGLILLFERPIRVGDKIQLADLFGTVNNIGMRASIVRTLQGAEVIVPNANLISAEVVNWTLSDERRRADIPIGVAYGTEPQTVIDILIKLAKEHPEVMDDPEPAALFLGFGASSLDFELRAWTRANFVQVSSELRVRITEALGEADIEIPFPQRDLHLRSVDQTAAKLLSGKSQEDDKTAAE